MCSLLAVISAADTQEHSSVKWWHFKSEHYLPKTINKHSGSSYLQQLHWCFLGLNLCTLEISGLHKKTLSHLLHVISCVLLLYKLGKTAQTHTDTPSHSSGCCSKMSRFHGKAADLLQGLQRSCSVFCLPPPDSDSAVHHMPALTNNSSCN